MAKVDLADDIGRVDMQDGFIIGIDFGRDDRILILYNCE